MSQHVAEARMTSKGQITIPKKVKEQMGANEGDYILFFEEDGRIFIEAGRVSSKKVSRLQVSETR